MLAFAFGEIYNQWLTFCSASLTVTYVTEPSGKQKAFTAMATGLEGEVAFITGVACGQG